MAFQQMFLKRNWTENKKSLIGHKTKHRKRQRKRTKERKRKNIKNLSKSM